MNNKTSNNIKEKQIHEEKLTITNYNEFKTQISAFETLRRQNFLY